MYVKVITPGKDGKITLTKDELEAMLREAYQAGHDEKCAGCNRGYWWNYPTVFTSNQTPSIANPSIVPYVTCENVSNVNKSNMKIGGVSYNTANMKTDTTGFEPQFDASRG